MIQRAIIAILCTTALSASAIDVSHSAFPFHFSDEEPDLWGNGSYERHVVRPSLPLIDIPSSEGKAWLSRIAEFVRFDAIQNGYLNPKTSPHYERELRALQEGFWPTVFVTKKGSEEILATVSYAIRQRWSDLLPFQERFPKRAGQWSYLGGVLGSGIGTGDFRRWFYYPELGMPHNENQIAAIFPLRAWGIGDVAEVKFLTTKNPRQLRLIQTLIDGTIDHELARFGRIPMSKKERDQVREASLRLVGEEWKRVSESFSLDLSITGPDSELTDRVNRYFRENLFCDEWQPYARISRIYVQVSGNPTRHGETARARRFVEAFGFPRHPAWSFLETAEEGTEGIRTDIFEMTVSEFERSVSHTLEQKTGIDLARVAYYESQIPCCMLVSALEGDLYRRVGR